MRSCPETRTRGRKERWCMREVSSSRLCIWAKTRSCLHRPTICISSPAVGMAIYAANAKRVTDEMFIEAAHAVADQVTPEQLKLGMLFPPQSNILEVEIQTAARVSKLVFDSDLARVDRPADMETFIRQHLYKPEYRNLVS